MARPQWWEFQTTPEAIAVYAHLTHDTILTPTLATAISTLVRTALAPRTEFPTWIDEI